MDETRHITSNIINGENIIIKLKKSFKTLLVSIGRKNNVIPQNINNIYNIEDIIDSTPTNIQLILSFLFFFINNRDNISNTILGKKENVEKTTTNINNELPPLTLR